MPGRLTLPVPPGSEEKSVCKVPAWASPAAASASAAIVFTKNLWIEFHRARTGDGKPDGGAGLVGCVFIGYGFELTVSETRSSRISAGPNESYRGAFMCALGPIGDTYLRSKEAR